ncbi:hypothetical protein [Acidiplasma cupricumulans]|jgi:hypothetical protein|uniref:Uncharacterized protein n=1 Tax=Acidiplasma cupricumulans TaxID=312540 RepID=A0A0Q0VVN5_9ARCH|nr:hypothetical protein [Acidiplasma cupricumulans]KQB35709.1 hypothetical protein AOG55_06055 [Acidiplasma cupricumulans]
MFHTSWHIKEQNLAQLDLLQTAVNAAYAIDQIINNRSNNDLNAYIDGGEKLLNILSNKEYENDDLICNINLKLREIYRLNRQELSEKLLQLKKEMQLKKYKKEQIDVFLNIYNAIKEIKTVSTKDD